MVDEREALGLYMIEYRRTPSTGGLFVIKPLIASSIVPGISSSNARNYFNQIVRPNLEESLGYHYHNIGKALSATKIEIPTIK